MDESRAGGPQQGWAGPGLVESVWEVGEQVGWEPWYLRPQIGDDKDGGRQGGVGEAESLGLASWLGEGEPHKVGQEEREEKEEGCPSPPTF